MSANILEIYTEEKSLTELIQEWINENNSIIYCNIGKKDIKYQCR